jgi:hypothetical protein
MDAMWVYIFGPFCGGISAGMHSLIKSRVIARQERAASEMHEYDSKLK